MKHKKLLSILLALTMLLGLLPAAALSALAAEEEPAVVEEPVAAEEAAAPAEPVAVVRDEDYIEIDNWNTLAVYLIDDDTTAIRLADNLFPDERSEQLVIPEGKSVTLDLNGYELDGYLNGDEDNEMFYVGLLVVGDLTLEDNFDYENATEDELEERWGGICDFRIGAVVVPGGTLTMNSGDFFWNGTGVAVFGGEFVMNGGYVDFNEGAGVYVDESDGEENEPAGGLAELVGAWLPMGDDDGKPVPGSFTMTDGLIAGNGIGVAVLGDSSAAMSGGVIGAAAVDYEGEPDAWKGNVVGVVVGGGAANAFFDYGEDDGGDDDDDGGDPFGLNGRDDEEPRILSLLKAPAPETSGGSFAMSGKAEISGNRLAGVVVSGGYDVNKKTGAVTWKSTFDMQGGLVTDLPDADYLALREEPHLAIILRYPMLSRHMSLKLGLFVNGGAVTMSGGKITGAWTEADGLLPLSVDGDDLTWPEGYFDEYDLDYEADDDFDTLEFGAVMMDGSFAMSGAAEISGHNIAGVVQGYLLDMLMKEMLDRPQSPMQALGAAEIERLGSDFTMNGGKVANNGLISVLVCGAGTEVLDDRRLRADEDDKKAYAYNASFTMNGGSIVPGKGSFLEEEIGIGTDDHNYIFLDIHPQVDVAAIGAEITLSNGAVIGKDEPTPFLVKGTPRTVPTVAGANGAATKTVDVYDLTLEQGVVMMDGHLTVNDGSISGHNLGGVLTGYFDDPFTLYMMFFGDMLDTTAARAVSDALEPVSAVMSLTLPEKTETVVELAGGAVENNGLFGIIALGTRTPLPDDFMRNDAPVTAADEADPVPVVINVSGGAVQDNGILGVGGYYNEITVSDGGVVSGSGLGVLAGGWSTVDVLSGGEISGNTVGVLGAAMTAVTLDGGAIVDNTKPFTVKAPGDTKTEDSLDELLALIGDLPDSFQSYVTMGVLVVRAFLGTELDEEDPDPTMAMVRELLADVLETGVVLEDVSSGLVLKSGELSGNTHGILSLSVDKQLIDFVESYMRKTLGADDADETPVGIFFSGAAPENNTGSDLSLLSVSELDVDKDGKTDEEHKLLTPPAVTVTEDLDDSVVRVSDKKVVVRFSEEKAAEYTPSEVRSLIPSFVMEIIAGVTGVDYEPVLEQAFTKGISDELGTLDNFQSAIEGVIVALDEDGEVMLTEGEVTLTLYNGDEELEDAAELTMNLTDELTLTAVVKPDTASQAVVWTSEDETIVTVEDGVLTAVGAGGPVTVTATADGGAQKTVVVTVEVDFTVTVSPEEFELFVGGTQQLTCTIDPEIEGVNFSFTSDKPDVAEVDADGLVTGVSAGSAVITATARLGDFHTSAQAKVTVRLQSDDPTPPGPSDSYSITFKIDGKFVSIPAKLSNGLLTPDSEKLTAALKNFETISSCTADISGTASAAGIIFPADALKLLVEKGGGLGLYTADTALSFDAVALKAIQAGDPGNMTMLAKKIGKSDLSSAQQKQLEGKDVAAILRAELRTAAGAEIHDLGGGKGELAARIAAKENMMLRAARLDPAAAAITADARRDVSQDSSVTEDGKVYARIAVSSLSEYALWYASDEEAAADCPRDESCPMAAFDDLDRNAWYHDGVHYVLEKGWMQGFGNGKFIPGGTTTRAMAAQLLWNMAGKPEAAQANPFADVAEDAWYAPAVRWAAEKGVIEGWTDPESGELVFAPEEFVTREQFAAMLYRYAKLEGKGFEGMWSFLLDFPDAADVSPWADEAMHWMVMQGVINGIEGTLQPQGSSTRAQIATMVYRYATVEK